MSFTKNYTPIRFLIMSQENAPRFDRGAFEVGGYVNRQTEPWGFSC
jgi:hypothetical protein